MIKVTQKNNYESISCIEDEVILSGPPAGLAGYITFKNDNDEPVFIQELPLHSGEKENSTLPVHMALGPRESRSQVISYSLDPFTPAGTYERSLLLGKSKKKLLLIVHDYAAITLSPNRIFLNGAEPGQVHSTKVLFSNRGNMDIIIPSIRHSTITDADILCRNLSLALHTEPEEGAEKTLDKLTRGIKKDLSGWVEISIKEAARLVKPGQTVVLNIDFKMPNKLSKNYQYEGAIRILEKTIRYSIINNATIKAASN